MPGRPGTPMRRLVCPGPDVDEPGDSKYPRHLRLWRGQRRVTSGVAGLRPRTHGRCPGKAAGDLNGVQIGDGLATAGLAARRACKAELRDGCTLAAFTGSQIRATHKCAFLLKQ